MLANNPFIPSGALKRALFKRYPDDLRPSGLAGFIAHFSTAVEGLVPLVLFLSHGGWPTAIAACVMILFHLAFPMGVPLERNVFMIFGVLWLFVAHARLGLSDLANPLPVAILFTVIAGTVVIGNLLPRKVSFLPGMRYYAGNWDTTVWCVKPSADEKFRIGSRALGPMYHLQLERLYKTKEEVLVPIHLAFAFRGMNTHGRALYTRSAVRWPATTRTTTTCAKARISAQWFSVGTSATGICTTSASLTPYSNGAGSSPAACGW